MVVESNRIIGKSLQTGFDASGNSRSPSRHSAQALEEAIAELLADCEKAVRQAKGNVDNKGPCYTFYAYELAKMDQKALLFFLDHDMQVGILLFISLQKLTPVSCATWFSFLTSAIRLMVERTLLQLSILRAIDFLWWHCSIQRRLQWCQRTSAFQASSWRREWSDWVARLNVLCMRLSRGNVLLLHDVKLSREHSWREADQNQHRKLNRSSTLSAYWDVIRALRRELTPFLIYIVIILLQRVMTWSFFVTRSTIPRNESLWKRKDGEFQVLADHHPCDQ